MADPRPSFVLAPIDQGIRNVGGREGAREGPERLLAALEDEGLAAKARVRRPAIDNEPGTLEDDLARLSDAVEAELEDGRLPVVLGGDHGTTFATVRGAARALDEVGVTYLDVHLDVRGFQPDHTSGSSFRRLVEEGWVEAEHVHPVGIEEPEDPHAASGTKASFAELQRWATEHGIEPTPLARVRDHPEPSVQQALADGPAWCFSIDADAVDRRWAPGVSAPGEDRLSLDEARRAAAAARGRFAVLDIVEYSPPLDEDDRTLDTCVQLLAAALGGPA